MVNTIILESSIKPHTKWVLAECLMCVESTLMIEIRICGMVFISLLMEDLALKDLMV